MEQPTTNRRRVPWWLCALLFLLPSIAQAHGGAHASGKAAHETSAHVEHVRPALQPSCPAGSDNGCCCNRRSFEASGQPVTFKQAADLLRVIDWQPARAARGFELVFFPRFLMYIGAAGPRAPPRSL
jgi:hypothetical protein